MATILSDFQRLVNIKKEYNQAIDELEKYQDILICDGLRDELQIHTGIEEIARAVGCEIGGEHPRYGDEQPSFRYEGVWVFELANKGEEE